MAFITCNFHSNALGKACQMNVIIPQTPMNPANRPYPVLYLLHGLSDDSTIWARRTSIERYAAEYDLAIVMPDGERGFYTDAQDGFKFWTMISEELPQIVSSMFHVSTDRDKTFAAGLSMGGYGALKLALRCPDRFAGAVGISSVADIKCWLNHRMATPEMQRIFTKDGKFADESNDLLTLASQAIALQAPPKIMTICGTEDFLYQDNQTFRKHMESIQYPGYQYREGPGSHSWEFWDTWIQVALKFLLGK